MGYLTPEKFRLTFKKKLKEVNTLKTEELSMESEEIKKILKASFPPYRCEVEIEGFKDKMSFRVFNKKNEPIITVKKEIGWRFGHTNLDSIIRGAKKEIKQMGYSID